jgi:hypothetical protein
VSVYAAVAGHGGVRRARSEDRDDSVGPSPEQRDVCSVCFCWTAVTDRVPRLGAHAYGSLGIRYLPAENLGSSPRFCMLSAAFNLVNLLLHFHTSLARGDASIFEQLFLILCT